MTEKGLIHFTGKRVLITGASGYLATNLAHLLRNTRCTIIRLSRHGELPSVSGIAHIVDKNGDLFDRRVWEQVLEKVDVVYHFAAQTSVYEANRNPLDDLDNNVVPMLNLLETCRQREYHPTILFSSTVTIAGIPNRLPVDESYPDNPVTVYDLHKLMAEQYLGHYVNEGIVRGAVLRLANVYGPGPESSRSDRGILNQMIRRAIEGKTLTIYGDGCQIRDYIYVDDVIWAFIEAYRNIDVINGHHFVIGSGQEHSIAQALNLVADRVAFKKGKRVEVIHIDPPANQLSIESRDFIADTSRFRQATGWQPHHSIINGIDHTIEVSY